MSQASRDSECVEHGSVILHERGSPIEKTYFQPAQENFGAITVAQNVQLGYLPEPNVSLPLFFFFKKIIAIRQNENHLCGICFFA